MSIDSYCVRSLLRDSVLVKPHLIGSNYREVVWHLLSRRLEGLCSRHGYIVRGSIAVHKINNAKVQAFSLNGDVCYQTQFHASVCNPPIGAVLTARVVNMNKFGIMTHSGITAEDGTFKPIIESIVTRQSVSGSASVSDVDLDTVKLGDTVFVEILAKKFELNDEKISVIGRIVSSAKPNKRAARTQALSDVLVREDYEDDPEEVGAEEFEEDMSDDEDPKKKNGNGDEDDEDDDGDGDGDGDGEDEGDGDGDDEDENDDENENENENENDEDNENDDEDPSDDEDMSDGDGDDDEGDDVSVVKKPAKKSTDPTGKRGAKKVELPPKAKKGAVKMKKGGSNDASEFFNTFEDDFGGGSDGEFDAFGAGETD